MKNLNKYVDKLKDIFSEEIRVEDNKIVGTPVYIEFTEDKVPNLVQLYAEAERSRVRDSDARMTVVMAEPKYGPPVAVVSIEDLFEIFGEFADIAKSYHDADGEPEDDEDDEPDEPEEEHEPEEEPHTAVKIPVPGPPPPDLVPPKEEPAVPEDQPATEPPPGEGDGA